MGNSNGLFIHFSLLQIMVAAAAIESRKRDAPLYGTVRWIPVIRPRHFTKNIPTGENSDYKGIWARSGAMLKIYRSILYVGHQMTLILPLASFSIVSLVDNPSEWSILRLVLLSSRLNGVSVSNMYALLAPHNMIVESCPEMTYLYSTNDTIWKEKILRLRQCSDGFIIVFSKY